jgi:hypothetical protein
MTDNQRIGNGKECRKAALDEYQRKRAFAFLKNFLVLLDPKKDRCRRLRLTRFFLEKQRLREIRENGKAATVTAPLNS